MICRLVSSVYEKVLDLLLGKQEPMEFDGTTLPDDHV